MYCLLVFALALVADCRSHSVPSEIRLIEIDNHIEPIGLRSKAVIKRYLSIVQRPKRLYEYKQGETLQLVCDAVGSPAPSVRWFKNDAPVYEFDMESNEVLDSAPYSVARVTSTLLVTRSSGRDKYTCLVAAGDKTARANSVVYSKDGSTDLSERLKLYPLEPRVVVWYKMYINMIGNNVVLPCRAKGHPRPEMSWRDNKGNLVKNDSRMQVLRSGELVISELRWSDMGEFTCHATNLFGTTATKTFLYPAKPS